MKLAKTMLVLAIALLGIVATASVSAGGRGHYRGSRVHFGIFVGAPAYWHYPSPYYYYPPYYPSYYPPVAASPAAPTTYIERGDARAAPEQAQDYWYYCPEAQAYYPYVKQCAKGWQKVAPQPPN
jgi:hypothetical protein